MSYQGFKDLECWKQARYLRVQVFLLTRKFPAEEKYLLVSQIKRASRSITNNIAEGYGRYTYTDTRHFFIQARGSVTETMDHLIIAFDEKYINETQLLMLKERCEKVFILINGYLKYLDKKKNGSKPNS